MASISSGDTHGRDLTAVLQVDAGPGDGAEIVFDQNSQRIAVSIFPGQDAITARLIDLLTRACNPDFDDEFEDIIDEALDAVLDIGKDELAKVAPASLRLATSSPKSLH